MKSGALIIDVGTSVLKVAVISERGKLILQHHSSLAYDQISGIPGALVFDPDALLSVIHNLISKIISDSQLNYHSVRVILPTCQRLGFVFLDQNGLAIYGIPNIDRRAEKEANSITEEHGAMVYKNGGRWPGPLHLVSKILWLRYNKPDIWSRTTKILSISDWLVFVFSGVMISEPTTACETGLFDVKKMVWSEDLMNSFSIDRRYFSELVGTGSFVGKIVPAVARQLGLDQTVSIVAGGGDTEYGVVGCNAHIASDVAIIAGSSAPIEMVLEKPIIDPNYRTILNPGVFENTWLLESNAMLTGLSWTWIKKLLFHEYDDDGYKLLDELTREAWIFDCKVSNANRKRSTTVLGASIMDSRKGNFPLYGGIIFQFPSFMQGSFDRGQFALSALEGIVFAIKANLEQLGEVSQLVPNNIHVAGGMSRREMFRRLLQIMVPDPINFIALSDATILGGAMAAFTAIGKYKTLLDASTAMKSGLIEDDAYADDNHQISLMEDRYAQWYKLFGLCRTEILK